MKFHLFLHNYLIPFLLGATAILAFAPFNFYPIIFISIIGLLYVTNINKSKNIKSFMFGSGFFVVGIYWIYI